MKQTPFPNYDGTWTPVTACGKKTRASVAAQLLNDQVPEQLPEFWRLDAAPAR